MMAKNNMMQLAFFYLIYIEDIFPISKVLIFFLKL